MKNVKRKVLFIALLVVVILSMTGIAISAGSANANIKKDALNIALNDAGITIEEVRDVEIEIELRKGNKVVEVEFESKGKDYEYVIEEDTGKIINSKIKNDDNVNKKPTDNTKAIQTTVVEEAKITVEQAKEIAYLDAGIIDADVRDREANLDREKGVLIYEVDFEITSDGYKIEYEYDINAVTGDILDKKVEREKIYAPVTPQTPAKPETPTQTTYISKEQAKQIALDNAKVSEAAIRDYNIELDRERGVNVYEISFEVYSNGYVTEYEYDLDAVSGDIIKREIEIDD